MKNAQRRHDLSDEAWALIESHLPGQTGQWGGVARDNRLFINNLPWLSLRKLVSCAAPLWRKNVARRSNGGSAAHFSNFSRI